MNVNPDVACGAYGFNLGGWQGGQADYMMVPYADFALLKFPDKEQAMAKIKDLTLLSDILPTGLPRLCDCGRPNGVVGLHRRGRAGGPVRRRKRPPAWVRPASSSAIRTRSGSSS